MSIVARGLGLVYGDIIVTAGYGLSGPRDEVLGGARSGRGRRFLRDDAERLFYRRVANEVRKALSVAGPDAPLPSFAASAQGESAPARLAAQTAARIVREAQQAAQAGRIREREILDEALRLIDDAVKRKKRRNRIAMLLALWWFA